MTHRTQRSTFKSPGHKEIYSDTLEVLFTISIQKFIKPFIFYNLETAINSKQIKSVYANLQKFVYRSSLMMGIFEHCREMSMHHIGFGLVLSDRYLIWQKSQYQSQYVCGI